MALFAAKHNLESLPAPWQPIHVAYAHTGILPDHESFNPPSEDHVRSYFEGRADVPIVLDFEHGGDEMRRCRHHLIADTARRVKAVRPEATVGCYGQLPARQYWWIARGKLDKLRAHNDAAAELLLPAVDVLYPSLYLFYDLVGGEGQPESTWSYVQTMLDEAARVTDKPVRPFVWPRYHGSGDANGQLIPPELWHELCRRISAHDATDGLVVWGDAGAPDMTRLYLGMAARAFGRDVAVQVPGTED